MPGSPTFVLNASLPTVAGLYTVSAKQLNEDADNGPLGAVMSGEFSAWGLTRMRMKVPSEPSCLLGLGFGV